MLDWRDYAPRTSAWLGAGGVNHRRGNLLVHETHLGAAHRSCDNAGSRRSSMACHIFSNRISWYHNADVPGAVRGGLRQSISIAARQVVGWRWNFYRPRLE